MAVSQLKGSTITIISAHVPGQHMCSSAGTGPSSSSPKQEKSDGSVKIYNSVSEIAIDEIQEKKIIESTAI